MRETPAKTDDRRAGGPNPGPTVQDVASAGQIADPMLSRLFAYWDGKRGGRPFPGRSALDPVDIPMLLPSIFLVAVRRNPFDLVFRLTGTVLTGCYGGEMTGHSLIELPSTGASDLFREAARTVHTGRPVLLSGPITTLAESYRRADHLLLPLGEGPDRVDMLVGGAIFRGYPVGERPDRTAGTSAWGGRIRALDAVRRVQASSNPSRRDGFHAPPDRKITSA